jgi:hypothetical protein
MTRIEISQYVCNEMGLYDDTSLALAASFADFHYKALWDRYPWIDTQANDTGHTTPGVNEFALPATIKRIISLRATTVASGSEGSSDFISDSHFLDPITQTFLFETDPTILDRGGWPLYYEEQTDIASGAVTVRIYPTPLLDQDYLILGKAPCPGLPQNTSAVQIRGLDQTITTYVLADMLKRQRQYQKADQQFKIAQGLEAAAWAEEQQRSNKVRKTKLVTVGGNSLSEMVDSVCAICSDWTPETRTVIREFVRRNYQALYDVFLWPESIIMVRLIYKSETVVMPHYVDKILGIRGTDNFRLAPTDPTLFLDVDPTIFESFGAAIGYSILMPVGVAVLPEVATRLRLASTRGVDVGSVFIRGEVTASGTELTERVRLNGAGYVYTNNYYNVILTIGKDITFGDLTVNAADSTVDTSLVVIPANERERKHQRVLLSPIPTGSPMITVTDPSAPAPPPPPPSLSTPLGTLLVLAKRKIIPMQSDEDTPLITGAQQVLIAAAAADLFSSADYAKPDLASYYQKKAEAAATALIRKNEEQQAREPRFVPQIEPYAYLPGDSLLWSK